MSNLRPPSIALTPDVIRTDLMPRRSGKSHALAETMQLVAGTPTGTAILIERFKRP